MRKKVCTLLTFLLFSLIVSAQDTEIIGTIVDAGSGMPMPGVSIAIKGTNSGAVSDFDGNYTIKAPQGAVLEFTYMGYVPQQVTVSGQTKIDVSLQEDENQLEQVVVVGYGVQRKSDLTGSIAVVDMGEVAKRTVGTVDTALQGQVAGVDVTSASGTPGGGVTVRIRGVGTINDSNPLFVVDGMMVGDIDWLNAADVESIQVLKDASATAIYGSRGANGVVIITTKNGADGTMTVSLNSYVGFQNFWRSTNVMDAPTWAALRNEALVASGSDPVVEDPSSLSTTDWFDEISNNDATISSTDLSVSGGGEKGNYYVSGNYFIQDGVIKKTGFDRASFRANTNLKVKPWLTIGQNMTLSRLRYQNVAEQDEYTTAISTSIAANPASPIRNEDGTFARGVYGDTWNPVAILAFTNNEYLNHRALGNVFAEVEFVEGLKFKSNFSVEYSFAQQTDYNPVYNISPSQLNEISNLTLRDEYRKTHQWSNTLTYNRTFGDHQLTAMIGIEELSETTGFTSASANDIPSEDESIRFLSNAKGGVGKATVYGLENKAKQLSYLGRVNYSYMNRYLFTANIRADASSKFTKSNQWAYFPSFSLGWKVSDENFMQNVNFINMLKLRAGWGQIGNQASVAPYSTTTNASSGANYLWGGRLVSGIAFQSVGNENLKWETSTTLNFGVDFRVLNNRLSGTVDLFDKETTDMLLRVPVPGQVGLQLPPFQNAASLSNKGIEVSLNYKNRDRAFKYDFGIVFSKIKNEVIDLGAEGATISRGQFFNANYVNRTEAGFPIAQFYGYKTDGLFQTQAEADASGQSNVAAGDVRYKDLNGDGKIDSEDFTQIGNPLPDFTYGFNMNLEYNNVDFTLALQGVQGNDVYNGMMIYKNSSTANWNLGTDMINRWTGEGTQNDARYPRLNANDVNNSLTSDRFVEDGSYLRIKTVQLGYTLPDDLLNKIGFQKIRIYGVAQNLFTFTKYTGMDPELAVNTNSYEPLEMGIDRGYYPQARTYSIGLNLAF